MKKQKPGPQGLANLQTWRLPFSSDVKSRRRQTLENRRPHRLRAGLRPDAVLGTGKRVPKARAVLKWGS